MKYFVYCLMTSGEIIYIGSSTKLLNRIRTHRKDKEFDEVRYCELPNKKSMLDLEMFAIDKVKPPLNRLIATPNIKEKPEGLRWIKANLCFLTPENVDMNYEIRCSALWDYPSYVGQQLGIFSICLHEVLSKSDITFIKLEDKPAAVFDGSGMDIYELAESYGLMSIDEYTNQAYLSSGKISREVYDWSLTQFD